MIDSVQDLEYTFTNARNSTAPPHDFGVVAVIDGQTVKVTPFRTANIPPPMALHELSVQANVIDVAISAYASSIAVLHQQGISIFESNGVEASSECPSLTGRITFAKTESKDAIHQQISFAENNDVLVLQLNGSSSSVKRYGFDDETGRMDELPFGTSTSSIVHNLSSFSQNGRNHPFVQGSSGDLHSLTFGERALSHCNFPMYLPWVDIVPYRDDHIAFGMSNNGHLYANSRLLVKNCTSFLTTPAHLIFTTTAHLIKFVHITNVSGNVPLC
jgi:elongator complex protein 1